MIKAPKKQKQDLDGSRGVLMYPPCRSHEFRVWKEQQATSRMQDFHWLRRSLEPPISCIFAFLIILMVPALVIGNEALRCNPCSPYLT